MVAAQQSPRLVTLMAPMMLSAHAVAYRETAHRGSAVAEARRRSSQGDVPSGTLWWRAVVKRVTLGALAASSEEVAHRRAHHRALHPDVRPVVGPERYRPPEVHGVGYCSD